METKFSWLNLIYGLRYMIVAILFVLLMATMFSAGRAYECRSSGSGYRDSSGKCISFTQVDACLQDGATYKVNRTLIS